MTLLLLTSRLVDSPLFRLRVEPGAENGLRQVSHVMVDKAMTIRRSKVGAPFGRLDNATMLSVNRSLAVFLGFA